MNGSTPPPPAPPAGGNQQPGALPPELRRARYRDCHRQLEAVLAGEPDAIARMSSALPLLLEVLPQASFVGFYRVLPGEVLVAGPYQGPLACLRIRFGQGVCGAAAASGRSVLVADVDAFPGHIACDARARSELVVPVRAADGSLIAVLDLDSHQPEAFDAVDQEGCEALMTLIAADA